MPDDAGTAGTSTGVPRPGHGTVRTLGFAMRFRDAPLRVRHPAPDLGQHTAEILDGLAKGA